jgi:hypothetical protein
MAVFKCRGCGRLVFRPDNLLEFVLHCPTCGPQRIVDEPEVVNLELAALLEKEYLLAQASPSAVRYGPTKDKPLYGRKIQTDGQASGMGRTLIWIAAIVIAVIWLEFCGLTAKNFVEFSSLVALGFVLAVPPLSVAYLLCVLIGNAMRRYRVQKALEAVASSFGPIRVKSANDAVMPAISPKPEEIQSASGNVPSNEPR